MGFLLLACAFLILLKSGCHCKVVVSEEIPDISDLLPKPAPALNSSNNRRSNSDKTELLFDLNNIDETKFHQNVESLKKQLMELNYNGTIENSNKTGRLFGPYRRDGYLTRTPGIPYKRPYAYTVTGSIVGNSHGFSTGWRWPQGLGTHILSMKISDLMLQFIYMGRHKLMELDAQTIVKPKAENYRQVFLYKHLVRLSDQLWDVLQIIRNHTRFERQMWYDDWRSLQSMMRLHQHAVKLYVDFSYFWWVFMRIHERFMERTQVIITRPPSTEYTYVTTASMSMKFIDQTDYPASFPTYSTPPNIHSPEWIRQRIEEQQGLFFG